PRIAQERLFCDLERDLANVFMNRDFSERKYGGSPCHLLEKREGHFPQRRWKAIYYSWQENEGTFGKIIYKNFDTHVNFTFEPK
ncbi:MAG: hypothetical protein J5746_02945, partial [Victivallales bacterium]|nr:hypothetical protein [Victivallales bacterium]